MSSAEDDLHSPARDYMPRLCELGTVGWAGREELTDLGSAENDGYTFVCVTLYAGKTPGEAITKGVAQGREILCGINVLSGFTIPPRGTRVYVLFPSGMEEAAGAGVIVAAVRPGPEVRANVGTGDRIFSAAEGQARLILKTNGSIVLMTTDDNTATGKLVSARLMPGGWVFDSPIGSQVHNATGFHLKTKAGPRIDMGGVSIPGIPSDVSERLSAYITFTASKVKVAGAIVMLGVGPTYATAVTAPSAAINPGGVPITTGGANQSCSVLVTNP